VFVKIPPDISSVNGDDENITASCTAELGGHPEPSGDKERLSDETEMA
jgi:hypothetical protein